MAVIWGELTGFKGIQAPILKLILSKNQYFQFVIFFLWDFSLRR